MNRILTTLTALSLGALLMSSAPAQERRTASKVPPALLEAFDRDGDGRLNGAEATAARRALGERRLDRSRATVERSRTRSTPRKAQARTRQSASRGRGPVRGSKGGVRRAPAPRGKGAARPGASGGSRGAARGGTRSSGGRRRA